MKTLLTVVLVCVLAVIGCGQTAYHFATGGNDSNPGTVTSPKLTLAWFQTNARAGDVGLFNGGNTFTGGFNTPAPGLTLMSYGTGRAIFTHSGDTVTVDQSDTTLVNLQITSTSGSSIHVPVGTVNNTTVIDCLLTGSGVNGFNTSANVSETDTTDLLTGWQNKVRDTTSTAHTSDGYGIRSGFTLHLKRFVASNCGDDGISAHQNGQMYAEEGTLFGNEDGAHHVANQGLSVLERLLIYGNSGGDCFNFTPVSWRSSEMRVLNCILALNPTGAVLNDACVRHGDDASNLSGVLRLYNNYMLNPNTTANRTFCIYASGAHSGTIYAANNVMVTTDQTNAHIMDFRVDAVNGPFIGAWDYNRYLSTTNPAEPFRYLSGEFSSFTEWQAGSGYDTNSASITRGADPDAALGVTDYDDVTDPTNILPLAGSPLINSGTWRDDGMTRVDYTGQEAATRNIGPYATAYSPYVRPRFAPNASPIMGIARLSRAVGIATSPTYVSLDVSPGAEQIRRTGGGQRVVIMSSTRDLLVKVKLETNDGQRPAMQSFGVQEGGTAYWGFSNSMFELHAPGLITGLEIAGNKQATVVVSVY